MILFRSIELAIGGLTNDISLKTEFVFTLPYYSDDITWCISRAKHIPLYLNAFRYVKDSELYVMGIFAVFAAIIIGFLLTTFEEKPIDYFEMSLIGISVVSNSATYFQPKRPCNRFLYMLTCYIGLLLVNIFGAYYVVALTYPIFEDQLDSVNSLIENKFQLMGDAYVLEKISLQDVVILLLPFSLFK